MARGWEIGGLLALLSSERFGKPLRGYKERPGVIAWDVGIRIHFFELRPQFVIGLVLHTARLEIQICNPHI